jgi:TonB family protein
VILEAIIDRDGSVRDVRVLKPLPNGLDQAAMDAVRQWRFKPGTHNGEPVAVFYNLTVNFRLQ